MADDREKAGRMEWLRANEVDREQYLLGKKIDRQVDPLLASEDREREALASGPGALFINPTTAGTTADIAVKVKEDPLFLIRKKEEEAHQRLLSNPVKMKNLRELLAREKSSKHKSKKKKKQRVRSRSPHRSGRAKRAMDKEKRKYSPSPPKRQVPPPTRTAPIHNKQYSRSSLSREELEQRRQEMMADAESHGREREQRLRRLEEEHRQEEEERSTPHSHDFLQPLRVQSMSAAGSVQERIQRSIGSVQRTRASLDRHFLQK